MTSATVLFARTFPVVLTDILVSTDEPAHHPAQGPVDGEPARPDAGQLHPMGFARKIWGLREGLSIVYAGTVRDATWLRAKIEEQTKDTPYSRRLHEGIETLCNEQRLDVSFIVLQALPDSEIAHFSYGDVAEHESAVFGHVLTIGSAQQAVVGILDARGAAIERAGIRDGVDYLAQSEDVGRHMELAVLSSLYVTGAMTLDCLKPDSKIRHAAAGGLFEVTWPLNLLPASSLPQTLTGYLRGVGQFFFDYKDNALWLTKAVINWTADGTSKVLFTTDTGQYPAGGDIFIPLSDIGCIEVADEHTDTLLRGRPTVGLAIPLSSLILYIDLGGVRYHDPVTTNGAALLTVTTTVDGVVLPGDLHAATIDSIARSTIRGSV
ncbi:hypothetical protein KPL74_08835 [Bacillus sp. NP157]|nr:hypothetical protein KPL74_08835 [Bacillus sp. NP157]